ncbi:MAG: TfoX/Sxy family protein [Pseudomonadota bacterium]
MDRDFLLELFSEFGPIALRRMFSGFGIAADGVNFAMALRAGLIFRVDDVTVGRYEAEGCKPFQYETSKKSVVVKSYWHVPERLYDDPEELAIWAREAVGAAHRNAAKKAKRSSKKRIAKKPPKRATAQHRKRKTRKPAKKKRQAT